MAGKAKSGNTVTGKVTRATVTRQKEIDYGYSHRYSPMTERYVMTLDVALDTPEGAVYFKVRSPMRVSSGGPYAIVTFEESKYNAETRMYEFPADHPWFRKEGDVAVATAERAANVHLVSNVREGDSITIRGRVKTKAVSKKGNPYRVLTHVKRVQD
jgi:hypothetical protein